MLVEVAPEGQRFVVLPLADSDVSQPLTLISNGPRLIPK